MAHLMKELDHSSLRQIEGGGLRALLRGLSLFVSPL